MEKSPGVVCECGALKSFNLKSTDPEAGISPDVRALSILSIGKSSKILVCSKEDVVDCAYIEKTSTMSDAPMFPEVPRCRRPDLNAFVIVLSFVAMLSNGFRT